MKLTEEQLQEIKAFVEFHLNERIDVRLIHCMTHNEVISRYFFNKLVRFVTPQTSETICNFIHSLIKPKQKQFKFIPFLFAN